MKQFISKSTVAAALLSLLIPSACDRNEAPSLEVGKFCTIQFRRDALGAAATTTIPPMIDTFNGADTNIQGKFKRATKGWIVIEHAGGEIWIPESVVLLIKQ
jgi:hypothetical protein